MSCQNHGSIYGRWGKNTSNSANDSAGILGNITAYTAPDNGMGQSFTINVVDCVNGPGVKIYSNSMASGIVGFFSTDDNAASNNGAGPRSAIDGEYYSEYRSLPQLCADIDLRL